MQTTRIVVWFIALALSFMLNWSDSHCSRISSKSLGRSSNFDFADDLEKEGKTFLWKHRQQQQQPQTNLIIITRPTTPALPNNQIITGTGTATGTLTTTPLIGNRYNRNRYVGNRYSGNQRRHIRRGNVRPWQRRGYYYGREGQRETHDTDDEEQTIYPGESTETAQGAFRGGGVSAKLDVEQLGRSDTTYNAAGQLVVSTDEMSDINKQHNKRRRRLKPKTPQTTAIFASTMPTASSTTTTTKASKQPTYVDAALLTMTPQQNVNDNANNNSSKKKRPNLWQGLSERWRRYRERLRPQQMQAQAEIKLENDKDMIVIDDTQPLRIKTKRKNNVNRITKSNQLQTQKRKRKQQQQHQN